MKTERAEESTRGHLSTGVSPSGVHVASGNCTQRGFHRTGGPFLVVSALHFYAYHKLYIMSNYKLRSKSTFSLVQEAPGQRAKHTNSPYVFEVQTEFKQLLFKFTDNDFPHTFGTGY